MNAVLQEHPLSSATVNGAIWRYYPQYKKLYHFHAQLELLVVLRGHVEERCGPRVHRAHAGQLLWHLPGRPHLNVGAAPNADIRVIQIEPDLVPHLHGLANTIGGQPVVELQRRDFDSIWNACERTSHDGLPLQDRTPDLASAVDLAVQATLRERHGLLVTSLPELACNELMRTPTLTRPELCKALDVSEGYLSRVFRSELGVTLQEQRTNVRLAWFSTLVARHRLNWLEAALGAGFGSYSQCFRAFRLSAGTAPRQYFQDGGRNLRAEQQ